jgi:hypothetical protein
MLMLMRILLGGALFMAPASLLVSSSGCQEKKTVIVEQTETRHESEPQMTSPGDEFLVE